MPFVGGPEIKVDISAYSGLWRRFLLISLVMRYLVIHESKTVSRLCELFILLKQSRHVDIGLRFILRPIDGADYFSLRYSWKPGGV